MRNELKKAIARGLRLLGSPRLPVPPVQIPGVAPPAPIASKFVLKAEDLDAFVAHSDQLGGPDSPATQSYWANLRYESPLLSHPDADPYSDAYIQHQITLWQELSGRRFDQELNELCHFPFDNHLKASNPYARRDVSTFAHHLASLANVAIAADLPVAPRILDLGCGWGLTSEVFAFLGAEVTAIDIAQDFVDLVNARGKRLGLPMKAFRATFENFEAHDVFDMVLFYECLHHAVRPWAVLDRFANHLADTGKVVLAREPVQDLWWTHWGMRLDPFSIYCVRKFGWFESGFSLSFLKNMAARAGFVVQEHPDPHASVPLYILRLSSSRKRDIEPVPLKLLADSGAHEGWKNEGEALLIAAEKSTIDLSKLPGGQYVELDLQNNRGRTIALTITVGSQSSIERPLKPGSNVMRFEKTGILRFDAETWRPCDELGTSDTRRLSFHLAKVETYS
ncbi:MAG: class I SAM-dependent methyltransferase [Rhabdaerophilum sp.]